MILEKNNTKLIAKREAKMKPNFFVFDTLTIQNLANKPDGVETIFLKFDQLFVQRLLPSRLTSNLQI